MSELMEIKWRVVGEEVASRNYETAADPFQEADNFPCNRRSHIGDLRAQSDLRSTLTHEPACGR